ncbi:Mut7-C RNAse domain-containing protein [Halorubrum depositum]|uniref:Mut7-C RNAse domain-containing protein n=1 Tax=Halorubrum depositum TaxID=2583992 RepID=UPI0011A91F39
MSAGDGGAADPDDRPEYVPDDVGASPAAGSDSAPEADLRPAWRCRDCDQWFWKGSHWASVAERIDGI